MMRPLFAALSSRGWEAKKADVLSHIAQMIRLLDSHLSVPPWPLFACMGCGGVVMFTGHLHMREVL